jgi:hypothetical protein
MNATININGITYEILSRITPKDQENAGRIHLANEMRSLNQAAQLYLKRPKGRKMYFTVENLKGQASEPISL